MTDGTIDPLAADWKHRAVRGQVWLLALAAAFAVFAPLLLLVDHACAAAMPDFWEHSGVWFKELVGFVRPLGLGEVLLIIVLALGAMGKRRAAAEGLLGLIIVAGLVWILKISVNRTRPTGEDYSFPSGDAATCAVLIPIFWHIGGRFRRWLTGGAVVMTLAVAAARVVKEFHYPSDVAAGMALGILSGACAHALIAGRRIPVRSWWFMWALVLVTIGLATALIITVTTSNERPLTLTFMAAWVPVIGFLVAVPWLRRLPTNRTPRWSSLAAIAAGITVLLLFVATRSTLWDRDETFYAQTAQEMLRAGHWLIPSYNGEPFLHKPPLIYWLMASSIDIAGPIPLAFRVWSCLAMASILVLLGWMCARMLGPRSGPRLALLFATMPLLLVVGGAATTDAVLLLALIIAILPWVWALSAPPGTPQRSSWLRALIMGIGMGIGMLTKAPLGLAVPGATLVLMWWLMRRAVKRDSTLSTPPLIRDLTIATLVGAGMYLCWAIPVNTATHGEFLTVAIGKHVVGRAMAPMESHSGGPWYYIPVVLVACLPWTAYLPAALSALIGGRLGDVRLRVVVIAWFVPTFILMSLVATKLPHYILPALPGLALAIAATIQAADSGALNDRDRRWLHIGRWFLVVLFALVGGALIGAPWFLPVDDPRPLMEAFLSPFRLRHAAVGIGLVFLAMPLLVWRHWMNRPVIAARILAMGMIAIAIGAGCFALPALEAFKPSDAVGRRIQAASDRSVPVVTAGYDEPSLMLSVDRAPIPDLMMDQQVRDWATQTMPGILVITGPRLEAAKLAVDQPGLTVIDHRRGFDYSRGRWLELITIGRHLPPSNRPAVESRP